MKIFNVTKSILRSAGVRRIFWGVRGRENFFQSSWKLFMSQQRKKERTITIQFPPFPSSWDVHYWFEIKTLLSIALPTVTNPSQSFTPHHTPTTQKRESPSPLTPHIHVNAHNPHGSKQSAHLVKRTRRMNVFCHGRHPHVRG